MYNISHKPFIERNTQKDLRDKPVFVAWVYVLLKPLRTISDWFDELRAAIIVEYRYNGLLHSLENLLNDNYDPIDRQIHIITVNKLPIWFYQDESEQPTWYWKNEADTPDWYWLDEADFNGIEQTNYEFTIRIPVEISFIPEEILELVEIYRFAGLRPRIVTFGIGIPDEEVETDYYPTDG